MEAKKQFSKILITSFLFFISFLLFLSSSYAYDYNYAEAGIAFHPFFEIVEEGVDVSVSGGSNWNGSNLSATAWSSGVYAGVSAAADIPYIDDSQDVSTWGSWADAGFGRRYEILGGGIATWHFILEGRMGMTRQNPLGDNEDFGVNFYASGGIENLSGYGFGYEKTIIESVESALIDEVFTITINLEPIWECFDYFDCPYSRYLDVYGHISAAAVGGQNSAGYVDFDNSMKLTGYTGNIAMVNPDPVPEPTTIFLLGTGLIGLIGFGRKKFLKK